MRREKEPMSDDHKVGAGAIAAFFCFMMSIVFIAGNNEVREDKAKIDEAESKREMCTDADDPGLCLVTLERIEACNNLGDGEENCYAVLQEELQDQ